ncbi:CDP-alcohol phosphatidyltransferase family protein [Alkaliphilus serpentinus]|uniref:Phosphatidylglycerophosphate synthase n=2 Tax=Alkaliphilus serpentinus TaxID=1482731 RepID=A0A833M8V4_9FIRM|nr:CDP-alcohol phosphatidyltransferase family protein [Alkaliphilus serpentinus]KAB3525745.1 CDP-alcohol phosphatidyltransferase family protein [Alkaliphilus serpentinus]
MKAIPNYITTSRILLSIVLLIVKPLSLSFYLIYLACGFSDVIDGYIARKLGGTSKFGAKLDSIADLIMLTVLLILLYPIINPSRGNILWIISVASIRLLSILVALMKYKTFVILHTYGNKITGLTLFIVPLLIPYIDTGTLVNITLLIATISAFEELIIQITSKKLQLNRPSIFKA